MKTPPTGVKNSLGVHAQRLDGSFFGSSQSALLTHCHLQFMVPPVT